MPRVLVVAGTASGVGKTTLTLGLLAACRRRGQTVQAFKVGPDFIDPGLHEAVTGRPSWNLDGWMCGRASVLDTVARRAADADLAVVEGVMGCFDGHGGAGEEGSTAEVAKWLGAPVVLVIDASAQARSAAAVVLGFERFDPALRVGGLVLNRVGGEAHARMIREAVASISRTDVVGALPHEPGLTLPERHLGLVTAAEGVVTDAWRERLADVVERAVDLDGLLALAAPVTTDGARRDGAPPRTRARIGVARDAAFQFYYADNLERLRAAGAELVAWSPLADAELPDVDGLYLGGGYPELHAQRLSDNASMRKAVAELIGSGRPVYAECGGLMYLAESLEDVQGAPHRMVGVLPAAVRMRPPRLTLGYTEVEVTGEAPLGERGALARGHEFHYSTIGPVPSSVRRVYRVRATRDAGAGRAEGYLVDRALMSYVHLHFASNERLAPAFVEACAAGRR
jgi:cobyrinic acid a,c-diamide synthase